MFLYVRLIRFLFEKMVVIMSNFVEMSVKECVWEIALKESIWVMTHDKIKWNDVMLYYC